MKPKKSQILVIGYGNTLRSDDGIGQIVAMEVEKFNLPQVRSIYLHQLTPELAEKIALFETVIFIDASIKHKKVELINLKKLKFNNNWTHYISPESLLYLTEIMYEKTPLAWLITIPIKDLNFGENLSNLAQKGKQQGLEIIKNLINKSSVQENQKLCTK